jgi:hypothetical protein
MALGMDELGGVEAQGASDGAARSMQDERSAVGFFEKKKTGCLDFCSPAALQWDRPGRPLERDL